MDSNAPNQDLYIRISGLNLAAEAIGNVVASKQVEWEL
jgi:hypothetical protein